jgi:hypothetical protein
MAVVAALELEDLRASGGAAGEADTAHGRLGATVDHADFFDRGDHTADGFRHVHFEGVRGAEAESARGGFLDGLDDRRGGMAEDGWAPGAHEVDEFPVVDREEAASGGGFHEKRLAAHAAEGTNRGIHAAGDALFCRKEKGSGCAHGLDDG